MSFIGAILALLLLGLYAALPVFLGAVGGAVLGGVLSGGRARWLTAGGICGSVSGLFAFGWVWCSL